MAVKVVIIVSGGVVQAVFADSPDVHIEVVDHDNLEADGLAREARNDAERRDILGLRCVY